MYSPRTARRAFLPGILLASGAGLILAQAPTHRAFPSHTVYPGVALHVSSFTQAQQDGDVRAAYDDWKKHYLVDLKTVPDQQRIAFGKKEPNRAKTVSEGQGYGMVITAIMAGYDPQAQGIFDGLWNFCRAHPSSVESRLMAWEVPTGSGDEPDSAFDGDADIAYALLLADKQWGSGGLVNYKAQAAKVIEGIKAATIGKDSHLPLLGDWVTGSGKHNQWQTRSSDFIYGHFRAYGRATGDDSWSRVIEATQSAATKLQTNYAVATGLLPDFVIPKTIVPYDPKPAGPKFLEDKNDGNFNYNACRDPWRIGTDALLNNDAVSLAQVRKLSAWVEKTTAGNPQKIRAGYKLDGTPLGGSNYFTSVFVAPFGVAAMTGPAQQKWLDSIYGAVRGAREDYFEDSINLLCLLVMTGNFWDPTTSER